MNLQLQLLSSLKFMMDSHAALLMFLITAVVCSIESEALKNLRFRAPEAVRMGDDVTFACDYDLEDVALYSIRWYRYEEEFYRYLPKESPPTKVFPVKHVQVDVFRSNSREVTLVHIERETAGIFKCEVSSDAPLFHTQIGSTKLLVTEVPDEDPVLRTDVQKVSPGAIIRANCTTPSSYPQMNVTWFINDVEIRPKQSVQSQKEVLRYDALPGVETVFSSLVMRATQDLFKNSKIKLKCLATMFSMYHRSQEVELQENPTQLALIMVPTTENKQDASNHIRSEHLGIVPLMVMSIGMWWWLRIKESF